MKRTSLKKKKQFFSSYHKVLKIHLFNYATQEIHVSPNESLYQVLAPILKQRGMQLNDYVAVSVLGVPLPLEKSVSELEDEEIVIVKKISIISGKPIFNIYLPGGGKKAIIREDETSLKDVITNLCQKRKYNIDDHVVVDENNNLIELNSKLCDISGDEITLLAKSEYKTTKTEKIGHDPKTRRSKRKKLENSIKSQESLKQDETKEIQIELNIQ